MINFFRNQDDDESSGSGARLRAVEWKLNVLLGLVGAHLLFELVSFVGGLILPSKGTVIFSVIVMLALGWFFRDRLVGMIKRIIAQRILGETKFESSSSGNGHREGSIR